MRVLRTRPLAGPSAAIIRARAGADLAIARAICGESGRRTHPLDKLEALTNYNEGGCTVWLYSRALAKGI